MALVVISGCGGSSGGSKSSSTSGGTASNLDITIADGQPPLNIDPCYTNKSAIGRLLSGNVTEALTTRSDSGAIEPQLATSWKQINPTTWQFALRPNVKFQDGVPFNAAAVVTWITRVINPKAPCYVVGNAWAQGDVTGAKAVDDSTVQITTKSLDQLIPAEMSFVDIGAPSTAGMTQTQHPIGTGPYSFVSYTANQSFKVTANPTYWGPKPAVKAVTYLFRTESSVRAAMVKTGEADIALDLGPEDAKTPGSISTLANEVLYFRLDTDIAPLNNVLMRKAVNLAIDRNSFIQTVFAGQGKPSSLLVPPSAAGYDPKLTYSFDPTQAKSLIAQAKAQGVKTGAEIDVIGQTDQNGSNGTEIMDTIVAMLKNVGLNAKTVILADTAAKDVRLDSMPYSPSYKAGLVWNVHGNSLGDSSITFQRKVLCKVTESLICDKTADDLINAGIALPPGAARTKKFQQAWAQLNNNVVPFAPVAQLADTIAVSPKSPFKYTPNADSIEKIEIAEITKR